MTKYIGMMPWMTLLAMVRSWAPCLNAGIVSAILQTIYVICVARADVSCGDDGLPDLHVDFKTFDPPLGEHGFAGVANPLQCWW